jgi:DNA-binding NtrC family response regulator
MPTANQTILIVEDDTRLSSLLQRALENAGYRVVVSANTDSARQQIRDTCLALVVTDINLPDGSGLDLVADLQLASPHVPVLVMSAGLPGQDEALRRMIDHKGPGHLLEKPFSLEVLLDAVRKNIRPPA